MYYKEKLIEGVWCFKSTPNGEWIPMSIKQLTHRLNERIAHLESSLDLSKAMEAEEADEVILNIRAFSETTRHRLLGLVANELNLIEDVTNKNAIKKLKEFKD